MLLNLSLLGFCFSAISSSEIAAFYYSTLPGLYKIIVLSFPNWNILLTVVLYISQISERFKLISSLKDASISLDVKPAVFCKQN